MKERIKKCDKLKKYKAQYYQNNKDSIAAKRKEYYKKNKVRINKHNRQYYNENKDRASEWYKIWYKKNKEYVITNVHIYRDKVRGSYRKLNEEEKQEVRSIYALRDFMNSISNNIIWSIDHIIPVSKNGSTHPDNLQIMELKANIRKSNKTNICI